MPRPRRHIPPDSVVHLINRGNDRRQLFANARDYRRFLSLMLWTKSREPLRLIAYVLMPNHWHLVAWADSGSQISRFMHRLTCAHAARLRGHTGTVGEGHIYQDRFHSFIVDGEHRYFRLLRYVEANAVRAGLVDRAEDWAWSSLTERLGHWRGLIEAGPLPLPDRWSDIVNRSLSAGDLEDLRARSGRSHVGAWARVPRGGRK